MNERVFNKKIDMLRSPERAKIIEVDRVVEVVIAGIPSGSILDVGTGTGVFAEAFYKKGYAVSGVDINQDMITEAQKFVPNAEFHLAPAESIPFKDKTFDIVFFGGVLHEADDLVKALKEGARVTKKRIVALEWPYADTEKGPPLEHRLKEETVREAMQEAQLTKITITKHTHLMVYCAEIAE